MNQLMLRRVQGRRVLVVSLQLDQFVLIALETTTVGETDQSPNLSAAAEHVLNAHAHKHIGAMPDLVTAIAVAEGFADEWAGGTPLQLCQCGEVA